MLITYVQDLCDVHSPSPKDICVCRLLNSIFTISFPSSFWPHASLGLIFPMWNFLTEVQPTSLASVQNPKNPSRALLESPQTFFWFCPLIPVHTALFNSGHVHDSMSFQISIFRDSPARPTMNQLLALVAGNFPPQAQQGQCGIR